MNKIKFSHDYLKLPVTWEGTQAVLLGCCFVDSMIDLRNRLPNLVEKDTKFRGKDGYYQFPAAMDTAIILTLFHINTGTLFTTIRSYNDDKWDYYEKQIGSTFLLEKTS